MEKNGRLPADAAIKHLLVQTFCACRTVVMVLCVTLVLHCEVSGDKRGNLASEVRGVDLSSMFSLIILNNLGLREKRLFN